MWDAVQCSLHAWSCSHGGQDLKLCAVPCVSAVMDKSAEAKHSCLRFLLML